MSLPAGLQKAGLISLGILLAAWTLLDPQFHAPEFWLDARACLPLAGLVCAFALAAASGCSCSRSTGWLAVLVIGQAAALQLVQPTRVVGYQHYRTPADLGSPFTLLCLALIVLQALLATRALLRARDTAGRSLPAGLHGWRLALLLIVAVFAASAPSLDPFNYASEWLLAGFIQLAALLTLLALLQGIPPDVLQRLRQRLDRWQLLPGDGTVEPAGIDRFAVLCAAWVVVVSTLLTVLVYERHPHIADEVVYLLHAGYFAQGMLAMPLPPVPAAFDIDLMTMDAHGWYSAFPPGWPAMLALGSRFGVPWLVNPLLAGLCVLLAYRLARELVPAGSARLATLLLSLSPWFLFLAMSFMAHIFTLACVLGAALAVAQLRRQPGVAAAVIAGVLLGVTSLIRPLDGLAAALVLGLWSLGIPTWRDRLRYIPVLVLATAATGALVLPYNALLTGDPAVFPVTAYFDQHYGVGSNALGFGPDRGMDWRGLDPFPGHGLRDVIVNSYLNTFGTNVELFGWASGSLWLVLILFFSGRARLMDYRLLLAVLVVTGLHALYWFSGGPDFGARYWFLAIVPLILLSVRATAVVAAGWQQSDTGRTRIVTGMLVLTLSALLTFMPWRSIDKYHHYNNMRPDIRQLAHEHDFSNGLVLVRGKRFDDYMSAAVYNSADLEQGSVIYAWDRDAQTRDALVKALPDRTVWLVNGPTVTGSGFRVSAGPFTGAAPLPRWTDPAAAAGTR